MMAPITVVAMAEAKWTPRGGGAGGVVVLKRGRSGVLGEKPLNPGLFLLPSSFSGADLPPLSPGVSHLLPSPWPAVRSCPWEGELDAWGGGARSQKGLILEIWVVPASDGASTGGWLGARDSWRAEIEGPCMSPLPPWPYTPRPGMSSKGQVKVAGGGELWGHLP